MKPTPWAEFLIAAVSGHFRRQRVRDARVVDLGAGPQTIIARHLREDFPWLDYVAVEPYGDVDAPIGVPVFTRLAQVAPVADYVLFNPPSLPAGWIDLRHPGFHAWNGGTTGAEVIRTVMEEAVASLQRGGRYIFLCASFHSFQPPAGVRVEVLDHRHDPADTLLARAPLAIDAPAAAARLHDMVQRCSEFWHALGVRSPPGCYAMCAVSITKL